MIHLPYVMCHFKVRTQLWTAFIIFKIFRSGLTVTRLTRVYCNIKNSVPTIQKTRHVCTRKQPVNAVYSENHMHYVKALSMQNADFPHLLFPIRLERLSQNCLSNKRHVTSHISHIMRAWWSSAVYTSTSCCCNRVTSKWRLAEVVSLTCTYVGCYATGQHSREQGVGWYESMLHADKIHSTDLHKAISVMPAENSEGSLVTA